jgi:hypothetical protein
MQSAEYYLKVFNIYLLGVVAHTCDPSTKPKSWRYSSVKKHFPAIGRWGGWWGRANRNLFVSAAVNSLENASGVREGGGLQKG